jgi:phosphoenolpyruvate-protein kinase (PTS system EI component)
MEKKIGKRFLKGIAASPGIAIGAVCVLQDIFLPVELRRTGDRPSEEEAARFMLAVRAVTGELMEDYGKPPRSVHESGAPSNGALIDPTRDGCSDGGRQARQTLR